uniref:Uncharacterized protein n=1 Tax=Denticeps clupeoides TaxID=299321 RepID=A0AAY4CJI6_9TELE
MPLKDPLLETLKVCILNLQSESPVIDRSPHLSSCCELLELILRKGLQQPILSIVQRDYWHVIDNLRQQDTCGKLGSLSLAAEQTLACKKLLTAQGRGRYFLRMALNRRILGNVVQHVLHVPKLLEVRRHITSILTLVQMPALFETLNLPHVHQICETYEAVPCRELGMVLRYLEGRVFVLDLLPGSQAGVDGCVHPGDVIDEINGVSLRNASNGQAGVVLSNLKGHPLSFRLLRWRGQDGGVYRPLLRLLRALQQENPSLRLGPQGPAGQQSLAGSSQGHTQCLKEGSNPLLSFQDMFQYSYPEISCVGRYIPHVV